MVNPYIIVLGNEKGGSGKTTTAMHLIFSLIHKGYSVSCMDLDIRQLSLRRYLENREHYCVKNPEFAAKQKMPGYIKLDLNDFNSASYDDTCEYFASLFAKENVDFVVIDTPGNNTILSTAAHSFADLVITPINDSFIDIDLLVTVIGDDIKSMKPSIYSSMVWDQRIAHFKRSKKKSDWVIIRNRLSNLDSNNRRSIEKILTHSSKNLAFRVCSGFSERIIYRELFPYGLTLLDIFDNQSLIKITASHLAARQELRSFLSDLKIPLLMNGPENASESKDDVIELRERIDEEKEGVVG